MNDILGTETGLLVLLFPLNHVDALHRRYKITIEWPPWDGHHGMAIMEWSMALD